MVDVSVRGALASRLAPVIDRFRQNFADDLELGARFTAAVDGEVVLDLWGGWADRARTRPFGERTTANLFSVSKAVAALLVASAVDRGLFDYEQRVAEIWPAFGAAGKDRLTVGQLVSHQSGLSGVAEPVDWFDWDAVCAALAAQAPLFPPGSASGYGPITFGYLAGEVFRRVDGRDMGRALAEDWTGPLGLDLAYGLPDDRLGDLAELQKPPSAPDLGALNAATRAAFVYRGAAVNARDPRYRSMAIPSVNAHGTAEALARLMAVVACGGDGRLKAETLEALCCERIVGPDQVLPHLVSWAAGLTRGGPERMFGPNPDAVGHWGWGGSMAMADRERRLSVAYVMNRQGPLLVKDPRPLGLIEALYGCL